MITTVLIIHVLACLFLVFVVLLQQGKGADIGAVFGGSSQTVFGSSGAGNLLTKLTTATAVVFMLTSLTLAYHSGVRRQAPVAENLPLPESSAPAEATEAAEAPVPGPGTQPTAADEQAAEKSGGAQEGTPAAERASP